MAALQAGARPNGDLGYLVDEIAPAVRAAGIDEPDVAAKALRIHVGRTVRRMRDIAGVPEEIAAGRVSVVGAVYDLDTGWVDLRAGLGRPVEGLSVSASTPGVVFDGLLIMGSTVPEQLPSAPGDVRAYDVRTGALRWSFHTIPHPGEPGYETWPAEAWKVAMRPSSTRTSASVTTTSRSTQIAPAFFRSVISDGHDVRVRPRTRSASTRDHGP